MPFGLAIALFLLILIALMMMILMRSRRIRNQSLLLNRLQYQLPGGYTLFHRRANGLFFQAEDKSLDLLVMDIPEDMDFRAYLVDTLASYDLPYDGLTEQQSPGFSGWMVLEQTSEVPRLFVLCSRLEGVWVCVLSATDAEHSAQGADDARQMAGSIRIAS